MGVCTLNATNTSPASLRNATQCATLAAFCKSASSAPPASNATANSGTGRLPVVTTFCPASALAAAPPPPAPRPPPTSSSPSPPPPSPTTGGGGGNSQCVSNPTSNGCASYVYPAASVQADIQSLCGEMPDMPGCSIRQACTVRCALEVSGSGYAPARVLKGRARQSRAPRSAHYERSQPAG